MTRRDKVRQCMRAEGQGAGAEGPRQSEAKGYEAERSACRQRNQVISPETAIRRCRVLAPLKLAKEVKVLLRPVVV
ncbi:hypothetical protein NDU88_000423 [Pleurodeles waltl]|uniref:Uncharacterized protein n=1 Tax=Pleurodeles waltl TaxID=8319 RepID=A0AAV7VUN4_PLEWA|nr:hypothetical protein NDU88_000423 [Pleurodeles waltl]